MYRMRAVCLWMPTKLALWAWMWYFRWCYFLCSSIGITIPTDWRSFSPLDACRACPLSSNDYSHSLQGLLLCKTERCGATGRIWWHRVTPDLTPTRFSNGPYSELSRMLTGCIRGLWCPAQQQTLALSGLGVSKSHSRSPNTRSRIGSARNNNYLVIRKRLSMK